MQEFKASAAIALHEVGRIAFLDGFFTSVYFHRAIDQRGSLAAAFAAFLRGAGLSTPQLDGVVRIEATLAACRRALEAAGGADFRTPPPPVSWQLVERAPGVAVARVEPDSVAAMQAAERYLFEVGLVPALALCADAPQLVLPALTAAPTATGAARRKPTRRRASLPRLSMRAMIS